MNDGEDFTVNKLSAVAALVLAVGFACDTKVFWSMVADVGRGPSIPRTEAFTKWSPEVRVYPGTKVADGLFRPTRDRHSLLSDGGPGVEYGLSLHGPEFIAEEGVSPFYMNPYAGLSVTFPLR
jgi:hypothetical protein